MERIDRRVERTRQLLKSALLALIREKGFEALSVQDIIDRANVGRATFYAHFDNKEDLLVSGLEEFRTFIRDHERRALQAAGGHDGRTLLFSREVFAHASEHLDVFRAMIGKRSGAIVQRVFQRILVELVRDDLRATMPRAVPRGPAADPIVHYIAGAFWGLLSWWVDAKVRMSVDEIDALFRRLAVQGLLADAR